MPPDPGIAAATDRVIARCRRSRARHPDLIARARDGASHEVNSGPIVT